MSVRPAPHDYITNVLRGEFDAGLEAQGAGVFADRILAALERAGYRIVHDDDERARDERIIRGLGDRILYDLVRDGDQLLGYRDIIDQAIRDTITNEQEQT